MSDRTLIVARRIHTMNPAAPVATHLIHREGRIEAIGDLEAVAPFLDGAMRDDRFADAILLPGFVEGHSHFAEGIAWRFPYVGFFDRNAPDGRVHKGLKTIAEVVAGLRASAPADAAAPILAWGFDPIYFDGPRMTLADLDAVATDRPVAVTHASGHTMNVNSAVLELIGITEAAELDGLQRDADGRITGELMGPELIGRVRRMIGADAFAMGLDADGIRSFASLACRAGVTTATDLVADFSEGSIEAYQQVAQDDDVPLRMVPALGFFFYPGDSGVRRLAELRALAGPKLHLGMVKLVVDGSIQGFTARLRWPGYHNGAPNGLWYIAPAQLEALIELYHCAGAHLHIHTNGDEASEATVAAMERVLARHPRPDHRHTLQHCQMPDAALYRRIAALGLCCNLFSNHIYYWGDEHVAKTMGPTRAQRLSAARTATMYGVPIALHSDAPVTPLGPLFTAWCAVMRRTASGRVLGENERLTVAEALRAVTLGAAYTLKLDHLIGSLEIGKYADFAVLEHDPFEVDPEDLPKVGVRGTVVGGRYAAAGSPA
ncbi:hypothetical protein FHR90_002009 [Endobacter medicaginis]|uniref:Amidohydrolase n=1 Tax=Endobacter medicaginis TaxID=1181271 RepID=A0A850NPW8_9PROT|nr:amidohydrolase [Endobacter medicaginis]MBB3174173.1 hypothetical protein [Endobacter medicaginis]MCX5474217.1 amidohydrolase [Endobacter medicaginis]NVN29906.1 amidohydrolase [Endobacter medicaginis]